jgi:hypothetical protein
MNKQYNQLHSRREFLGVFAAAIPLLSFAKQNRKLFYTMEIFSQSIPKNLQLRQ